MTASRVMPATLEQGDGDTAVFLLHGVGGGKSARRNNIGDIAACGYRTIAWDMPGYGDSATVKPCTTHTLAASLQRRIAHTGALRNVILGHSMGGMIAQELVALAPQIVHRLVLSGTSAAFGRAEGDWQQQFLQARFAPFDAGLSMAQMAAQLVPTMIAADAAPQASREAQAVMAAVPQASCRAARQAIIGFNRLEELTRITVPTLCLAGEYDRNASPAVMRRMSERISGAQYLCLPGAGHLANMELPAAFNAAVLQFLKTHFPV